MDPDILDEICRLRRHGRKTVLATIVQVHGSFPRVETTKMLIRDDGSVLGSLGDGSMEADVWTAAQDVFIEEKSRVMQFDLTDDSLTENDPIPGGKVEVFVEAILPIPEMLIFGSDEIAVEISKIALLAGFRITAVDGGEQNTTAFVPTDNTYVVITTSNDRVLEWATKTNARYVGAAEKPLVEGGPSKSAERLQYGLDIGAVSPAEIAVGLVAEAIQSRRVGVKHPPRAKVR